MFKPEERFLGKLDVAVALLTDDMDVFIETVFAGCLVVHAEHLFHENIIRYVIWSRDFKCVPLGNKIPQYVAEIKKEMNEDGSLKSITRTWKSCPFSQAANDA